MPPKKRAAAPELSRLTVLAAGDEAAFRDFALELIASGDRRAREAALQRCSTGPSTERARAAGVVR